MMKVVMEMMVVVNGASLTTDRFGNNNSAYDFKIIIIYIPHLIHLIFKVTDHFQFHFG